MEIRCFLHLNGDTMLSSVSTVKTPARVLQIIYMLLLTQEGILVFRDDEKLMRGKYVSDELLKAIQESMYAIVVISQNYAFSRWCLIVSRPRFGI